jgi:hypothetical protein
MQINFQRIFALWGTAPGAAANSTCPMMKH